MLLTMARILLVLTGTALMAQQAFGKYARDHKAEAAFAFLYIAFLFTYNSVHWARAEFARFAIPVLPFVLVSLWKWIPKFRAVLYSLAAVSSVLAACSAIGIRNVLRIIGI